MKPIFNWYQTGKNINRISKRIFEIEAIVFESFCKRQRRKKTRTIAISIIDKFLKKLKCKQDAKNTSRLNQKNIYKSHTDMEHCIKFN